MDATFDQFKCASCRKGGINIFNYIKKIPLEHRTSAILVRSSATELARLMSKVHIAIIDAIIVSDSLIHQQIFNKSEITL